MTDINASRKQADDARIEAEHVLPRAQEQLAEAQARVDKILARVNTANAVTLDIDATDAAIKGGTFTGDISAKFVEWDAAINIPEPDGVVSKIEVNAGTPTMGAPILGMAEPNQ